MNLKKAARVKNLEMRMNDLRKSEASHSGAVILSRIMICENRCLTRRAKIVGLVLARRLLLGCEALQATALRQGEPTHHDARQL